MSTYEIAFYKEGYETIFRQYTIYPGVTVDVKTGSGELARSTASELFGSTSLHPRSETAAAARTMLAMCLIVMGPPRSRWSTQRANWKRSV